MQKILLIAPSYLKLYQYIVNELRVQGYEVTVITEHDYIQQCPETPYHSWTNYKPIRKFIFDFITCNLKRFWKKEVVQNKAFHYTFQYCIVIQGELVNRWLLDYLKKKNKSIKTVLYVWDSSKYYDYFRVYAAYDKVCTVDSADAQKFKGVEYLPFFIPKDKRMTSHQIEYDISTIGTDHDMRSNILRKQIIPQCEREEIQYFFKLLPFDAKQLNDNVDGLFTAEKISDDEYNLITAKSNCILDIDRHLQQALTPRFLWALSSGKKIITTNNNCRFLLKDYCSSDYIDKHIDFLDRNQPLLNYSFCKERIINEDTQNMLHQLFIENWIKNLLI